MTDEQSRHEFIQAMLSDSLYSREYSLLDGALRVVMRDIPRVGMDKMISAVDSLQHLNTSQAKIARVCRELRVVAYVHMVIIGDDRGVRNVALPDISDVLSLGSSNIEQLRSALQSLDFASEALYNILERLTDRFIRHLTSITAEPAGSPEQEFVDKWKRLAEKFEVRREEEDEAQSNAGADANSADSSDDGDASDPAERRSQGERRSMAGLEG